MATIKRAQDDIEAQQKLLDDDSLVSQELSQLHPINSPLSLTPPPSMQYFSYSQDNLDNQVPIYPHPTDVAESVPEDLDQLAVSGDKNKRNVRWVDDEGVGELHQVFYIEHYDRKNPYLRPRLTSKQRLSLMLSGGSLADIDYEGGGSNAIKLCLLVGLVLFLFLLLLLFVMLFIFPRKTTVGFPQ
jgi:hypothetical protein